MPIKVSIQIPSQNVLNYLTNNNFKLLKHKFYNNAQKKFYTKKLCLSLRKISVAITKLSRPT
jgi:hypothetical protein